jgi:hypothetical protein
MERGATEGRNPRHTLYFLQQLLGARTHAPDASRVGLVDRLLAKVFAQPMHWALARELSRELGDGDVVYLSGDDVGLPLILWCVARRRRPVFALWVMAPQARRFRWLTRLLRLDRFVATFIVNSAKKVEQMQAVARVPASRVFLTREQTDVHFFTPGPRKRAGAKPMIFSSGLERRDYRTLALATKDVDVDVCICAMSPNASRSLSAFPDPVPANMSIGAYPWPDYLQAFRDADLVVVPLLQSDYSPGFTVLMEAMACRRPVILTRTPGSGAELIDGGYVTGVRPGDPDDMRAAIQGLLADPEHARRQADRAFQLVHERYDSDLVMRELAALLTGLGER